MDCEKEKPVITAATVGRASRNNVHVRNEHKQSTNTGDLKAQLTNQIFWTSNTWLARALRGAIAALVAGGPR